MLRIYSLQQWYNLSDPGAEEALYDIQSMRAFCSLELGRDPIPDETTIFNFRHLLEAHELTKTVFEAAVEYLEARVALLRGGTSRRCDINRRLAVHQERGGQARSADAFLEEGQSMVLRHEGRSVRVDAIDWMVQVAGDPPRSATRQHGENRLVPAQVLSSYTPP